MDQETPLFKNKYRIESARLKGWDYRNNGAYFITICTKNRFHYFGSIENGQMELTEIGKLAHQFWTAIPEHFSFVKLDAFVIMPNHTHGILVIDHGDGAGFMGNWDDVGFVETLQCNVSTNPTNPPTPTTPPSTQSPSSNEKFKNHQMQKISPKPGSISTIIRSFKSVTTKHARKIQPNFGWQTRFHDHIIRDQIAYNNIRNYIIKNPQQWTEDRFYKL